MIDTVKEIAAVIGCILSLITLITLIVKPLREGLVKWVQNKTNSNGLEKKIDDLSEMLRKHIENDEQKLEQAGLQNEAILGLLRDRITLMYYKFTERGSIPHYERENLIKLYTIYHKMHGNTYVDVIYAELLELPVSK